MDWFGELQQVIWKLYFSFNKLSTGSIISLISNSCSPALLPQARLTVNGMHVRDQFSHENRRLHGFIHKRCLKTLKPAYSGEMRT